MSSESPVSVTAIFDIGKTNKKFLLFDQDFQVIFRDQVTLEPAIDDDGDPCEDLDRLTKWIHQTLDSAMRDHRTVIRSLNFATYGATLVHLNHKGEVLTPVYDYNKPYPKELLHEFYATHGGEEAFALETSSPPMGMLNSGLQLYWLKTCKPEVFRNIRRTLHFPQYLSYLFTGHLVSELTSIGCHTAMWDFKKHDYHQWLNQESVAGLLPEPVPVHQTAPVSWLQQNQNPVLAGPGIHDSSASLVPFLKSMNEKFLLISTGTWSITLNPFSRDELTFDELQRDCLCYLNIYGGQVKASRLHLGGEYDIQMERIRSFFPADGEMDHQPDLALLQNLLNRHDDDRGLRPELASRSGPCPSGQPGIWDLSRFSSKEEAVCQLLLDLACLQEISLRLAQGTSELDSVLVTGGFANNPLFLKILATRLPDLKLYTAAIADATALGAAQVLHPETDHKKLPGLDLKRHEPLDIGALNTYQWQFASNYSRLSS